MRHGERYGEFFMVWNPQGRSPTHRHDEFELAEREAKRLAELCPGQEFFILQAVAVAQKREPVDVQPLGEGRAYRAAKDSIPF